MSADRRDIDAAERTFAQRLLFTTPMRDLVRGRVSGRLDLTIYPERAGLPGAITTLVVNVTKRTRLRILEKADVARELAAHFAEGLAGGRSADELIEAFGDPKQAAKLIRRAKKRNRSRIIRAVKHATAAAFTIIALLYAGVLIWYVAGSGRVNPSHDYLEDMNAVAAAVPAYDRAWPVYRELFLALGPVPKPVSDCQGPNDDRWPETVGYIAAHQGELETIRRAAAMPGLGYITGIRYHEEDLPLLDPDGQSQQPVREGDQSRVIPTLDTLLPQIGYLRRAARLLWFDTLAQPDPPAPDRVIGNIEAMIGLAKQSGEHPTLISQLVRISIFSLAIDAVGRMLADPASPFTDTDLARLDRLFDPSVAGDCCAVSVECERLFFDDAEQHIYTDDGHGNGRLRAEMMEEAWGKMFDSGTPIALGAPISLVMPDRAEFRAQVNQVFDAAAIDQATPMWERDGGRLQALYEQVERSKWSQFRWSYLLIMSPAIDRVLVTGDTAAMQRDALRVAIALRRHQLGNNNRWPETLSQLVPTYLDSIPPDRFDGQPLRYKLGADGEPTLYSIGADFKDNDGVPGHDNDGWPTNDGTMRWRPRSEVESMTDPPFGDFILWPPLPDKPVAPDDDDDFN
jgi:hypothetical protein